MSIYTKFGDKGKTSLFAGKIVSKSSLRVNTYGTLDELNSFIGIVISENKDNVINNKLLNIQKDLFEIGAYLANPTIKQNTIWEEYLKKRVLEFEKEIDNLVRKLPPLKNFIFPGGGSIGSKLHFIRTLTRKAERKVVDLSEKEDVCKEILIYINRLSDLFFMYARYINNKQNYKEIIWKK